MSQVWREERLLVNGKLVEAAGGRASREAAEARLAGLAAALDRDTRAQ